MRYKTGRYTTGAAFILLGLAVLLHQLTDTNWIATVLKLWPLVIIGYGVEYLLATRNPERTRFDFGGAFFIFIMLGILSIYSIFGSFVFNIGDLKNATPANPIHFAEGEVKSLQVRGLFGKITVEASTDERVTIVPTYRSNKDRPLEQLIKDVGMTTTLNAGSLVIKGHKWIDQNNGFNILGWNATGVDLHIYAPAEIATQINHTFGNIEIRGMNNLRTVELDFGDIDIYDSRGDLRVGIDFGSLNIQNFAGALNADSSFGEVKADGEMLGRWDISNDFGSVKLALNERSSFHYNFNVDFGSVDTPFTNDESGTINGGEHPLKVDVSFGSIDVKTK